MITSKQLTKRPGQSLLPGAAGISVVGNALALGLLGTTAAAASVDYPDTRTGLADRRPIREAAGVTEQPADTLSLELLSCLGSPNLAG